MSEQQQTAAIEVVDVEIVKRGFFEIVVTRGELGAVVLDTTMLPPIVQQTMEQAKDALADANDTEVDSVEMRDWAAEQRAKVRTAGKYLEEYRMGLTRRIDAFKQAAMAPFRLPVSDLDEARKVYDRKLVAFETAEQNRRQAEAAAAKKKRDEELRRQAEEAARLEREAQDKLAALRQEAEAAALEGNKTKVAELVDQAQQVRAETGQRFKQIEDNTARLQHATSVTSPPLPKAHGFSVVTRWKCRVTDLDAFLKAVVDGKIPKAFVTPDQKALDKQAALLKTDLDYPGCEAYEDKGGSSRS